MLYKMVKWLFFSQIIGPDNRVVYSGERETNGKYTFAAHMDGLYSYCFSNQMSSMTPKVVMFSMEIGEAPKDRSEEDGKRRSDHVNEVLSCFQNTAS